MFPRPHSATKNGRQELTASPHASDMANECSGGDINVYDSTPSTHGRSNNFDRFDVRDDDSLFSHLEENSDVDDVGTAIDEDAPNGLGPGHGDGGVTASPARGKPSAASSPADRTAIGEERGGARKQHGSRGTDNDQSGNERDEDEHGTVSDPNDEDYADGSDVTDSETGEQQRPRKMRRRERNAGRFRKTAPLTAEEITPIGVGPGPGHDRQAVSFCVTKDIDAIYIHRFLPPKTLEFEDRVFSHSLVEPDLTVPHGGTQTSRLG